MIKNRKQLKAVVMELRREMDARGIEYRNLLKQLKDDYWIQQADIFREMLHSPRPMTAVEKEVMAIRRELDARGIDYSDVLTEFDGDLQSQAYVLRAKVPGGF